MTLESLGLVYQLGHGGFPCESPDDISHRMVVIEAPVIHQIRFRYCKCEKSDEADNLQQLMRNEWYPATVTEPATCATFKSLEAYRMYSVVGNMNVKDFMTSLERVTNTTASSGMTWVPVSCSVRSSWFCLLMDSSNRIVTSSFNVWHGNGRF